MQSISEVSKISCCVVQIKLFSSSGGVVGTSVQTRSKRSHCSNTATDDDTEAKSVRRQSAIGPWVDV